MKLEQALEIVSQTHAGMVRAHNEDSVARNEVCGLVVLADGMGGYNAGEVASGIAIEVLLSEIVPALKNASPVERDRETGEELAVMLLARGIHKANASIYQAAQGHTQYAGMGTTLV